MSGANPHANSAAHDYAERIREQLPRRHQELREAIEPPSSRADR